ncbi:hypothetical protein RS130_20835 [Paraglaciecola aquimarina]|uniref:RDD domain-containing protein n=1 Tax=Paraglaciecola aquimarina TaxID=1235557 RepID=A0ABU3T174_9ALTE|nr:hypothetical protein [Paraglaciecola aquimarina]MDU0356013.1 hypothetical protein [Paraglaciecola aquimarina]
MSAEKVVGMGTKGIIQSNKSSFSTVYRLVDMMLIISIYFLVLTILGQKVGAEVVILLLSI